MYRALKLRRLSKKETKKKEPPQATKVLAEAEPY